MIDLKLPDYILVNLYQVVKLPNTGGVYALYSKEGYLLYVGKTDSFKRRMHFHLTNSHKRLARFVKLFEEDNAVNRELFETYLINKWKPIMNIRKVISYSPLTEESKDFESFNDAPSIIEHYGLKSVKKINVKDETVYIEQKIISAINCLLQDYKKIDKAKLRRELDAMGLNVNLIMSKCDFDNLLMKHNFETTKRQVKYVG